MVMAIYQITNTQNGKRYIGSSIDYRERVRGHLFHLREGKHHSKHLQRAYDKYGENAFKFSILKVVTKKEKIVEIEQKYLDEFKPEYNSRPTAESNSGWKPSSETKALWSKQRKGRAPTFLGKKHSEETKKKIGEASRNRPPSMLGRKHTPETKALLSESHKGQVPWIKGKTHSEETRRKLSESHKGQTSWLKGKKGMFAGEKGSFYGKKHTKETREIISQKVRAAHLEGRARAILTEKQVIEIKKLLSEGVLSFAKIGKIYGVSRSAIASIKYGKNWFYVGETSGEMCQLSSSNGKN